MLYGRNVCYMKGMGKGCTISNLEVKTVCIYCVCLNACGRELPKLSQCHQRPWLFKITYLQLSYSCTIQSPFEMKPLPLGAHGSNHSLARTKTKNMSVFRERHYCIMSSFTQAFSRARLFLPLGSNALTASVTKHSASPCQSCS